ncbi:GtrA family protein [bacterium]|nr:GtrA family protein [bacterium]
MEIVIRKIWEFACDNKYIIAKYATVGAASAVIDFGVLYILTDWVGVYYLASATISFILAAILNYTLNRIWTFRSNGKRRKQLPIFFTIAILGLILNNNIMYLSVERFAFHYLWAKVFAAAIVTFWNFFGNKYLTFRIK